jgi:serine/threonine protein kinase
MRDYSKAVGRTRAPEAGLAVRPEGQMMPIGDHRGPGSVVEGLSLASWLADVGRSEDGDTPADGRSEVPPSGDTPRLHVLAGLVRADLQRKWRSGHPVGLESYLEALPELGSRDTIPAGLILVEYEERLRSGVAVDLAEYAARFPRQAEELRRLVDRSSAAAAVSESEGAGVPSVPPSRHLPPSLGMPRPGPIRMPRQFGRYRILKRLGRGAMGTVYLAYDTHLDRRVALKVPHAAPGEDGHDQERFDREVRAAAVIHHPNLCPVYDHGQIDGVYYLTMAYIKGRPLSALIDRDRPLPQRRVAVAVHKLALALAEAHARGVIHRDLKPSNIMVAAKRNLVILDFGLAWRVGAEEARLTKTGAILGTPAYMSPEQFSGDAAAIDPRCDIYSLGVIFYELLTARRPYEGTTAAVMGQILYRDPEPPSRYRTDLDARLEAICLKAMAKKAEDRFHTMVELATALDRHLRGDPASSRLSSRPVPPTDILVEIAGENTVGPIAHPAIPVQPPSPGDATIAETTPVEPGGDDPDQAASSFNRGVCLGRPPSGIASQTEPRVGLGDVGIEHSGGGHGGAVDVDLKRLWRVWTRVIEVLAFHQARRHVAPEDYATLHRDLVATCRSRKDASDAGDSPLFEKLLAVAEPWLTSKSVLDLDQEMAFDLVIRCRQAGLELHGLPQAAQELGARIRTLREPGSRRYSVAEKCWFTLGISLGLLLIVAELILVVWQSDWLFTLPGHY